MKIDEIDFVEIEKRILSQKIEDVHLTTAMRIFKVDAKDVTPEMRKYAKTINFLVYGVDPCA